MSTFIDSPEQAKQDSHFLHLTYEQGVFRQYFTTPFQQYKSRIGTSFEVVKQLPNAEAPNGETGEDMYLIRFEDGEEIHAYGHEVCVLNYNQCI